MWYFTNLQFNLECKQLWKLHLGPIQLSLIFVNHTPEWPDLAKFRHFGKILKVFGNFSRVNLVFGNICDLFWQILYAVEQILIDGNDQILKKYSRHLVTLSYNHLISSTPSRYCRIVCNKLMVPPYLHLAFKIDWIDPPSALNKNINKMSQITFFIFVKSWSCLV